MGIVMLAVWLVVIGIVTNPSNVNVVFDLLRQLLGGAAT